MNVVPCKRGLKLRYPTCRRSNNLTAASKDLFSFIHLVVGSLITVKISICFNSLGAISDLCLEKKNCIKVNKQIDTKAKKLGQAI